MEYSTPELLTVTRVSGSLFKQWIDRGHLSLSSGAPGTGNRRQHTSRDVLQVAVLAELARLGVPPNRGKLVWLLAVAPALAVPGGPPPTVLLAPREDGSDHDIRVVHGDDYGLDAPGAPAAFVALRLSVLVQRIEQRTAQIKELSK